LEGAHRARSWLRTVARRSVGGRPRQINASQEVTTDYLSVDTGARHKCRDFVTPAERLAARFGKPLIRARARSLLCVLTSSQTQTRERGGLHARNNRSEEHTSEFQS